MIWSRAPLAYYGLIMHGFDDQIMSCNIKKYSHLLLLCCQSHYDIANVSLDPWKSVHISGVGTVAAVAALAATLFRLKMNIHNLL